MLSLILSSLYFMLPAYIANALPVISKHLGILKFLAKPLDGGKEIKGKELFGRTKTIRGFVVGIIGSLIIGYIQFLVSDIEFINNISIIPYNLSNSLLFGFLLGTGALLGDLVKSFIKRRIGIKSSDPWIIADQIDYVLGALLLVSLIYIPPLSNLIIILVISPLLAIGANIVSYLLGMKKVWW